MATSNTLLRARCIGDAVPRRSGLNVRFLTRFGRTAAAMIALFAFGAPALAQNLVPNPDFNTVLAPWVQFLSSAPDPTGVGAAPVRVAPPDFNNSGGGSARIDINTTTAAVNAASGISQCFNFATPTAVNLVDYGAELLVPSTTTTDSSLNATVEIRLYSGAACSGFLSGGSQGRVLIPGLASNSTWYALGDNAFSPTGSPVTVASAEIRGYLRQTNTAPTQTDYKVNFDHFTLLLNGSTPVRLLNYNVE
jgi:hypothetical protein